MPTIGIIGLGEAGAAIAAGFASAPGAEVFGFDVRQEAPHLVDWAARARVRLTPSLPDLVEAADIAICLTSASSAMSVVDGALGSLSSKKIFADYNSTGPSLKQALAARVHESGALFVDGAVMSAVVPLGHRVQVLLSGDGAAQFAAAMEPLGANVEIVGDNPGQAAAIKMFRSLLVKGLEALLLECVVGADQFGATDRVLRSMQGSLPFDDWTQLANYLTGRTVLHGERRSTELRQVAETLTGLGIEPLLAEAGARRLHWAAESGLNEHFNGTDPDDYHAVVSYLLSLHSNEGDEDTAR